MWETVAEKIVQAGGTIVTGFDVRHVHCEGGQIASIGGVDESGEWHELMGDYFFSTMPMKELIHAMDAEIPENVKEVSEGLQYRDFITVGMLLKKLKIESEDRSRKLIEDNWIYIQEPDVLAGRLQIFNNWSPAMVADQENVWIGVEYFCYESDDLWKKADGEMADFARAELQKIGMIDGGDLLDWTVLRMPKTYPAYFGTYSRFAELRAYLDTFENLYLIGRNGMHKYNNQDHSMLTAMVAVDQIIAGVSRKEEIWEINTEMEYHETKAPATPAVSATGEADKAHAAAASSSS
jgi:protoporphyrinogen oxidase